MTEKITLDKADVLAVCDLAIENSRIQVSQNEFYCAECKLESPTINHILHNAKCPVLTAQRLKKECE